MEGILGLILDINYMKSHIDLPFAITILSCVSMLSSVIAHIFISYLNNKRFNIVCDLYENQIGPLPIATVLFKNSSSVGFIVGYTQKMMFIMHPLIYKKSFFLNKRYSENHYDFINGLPDDIKKWFYAEYISLTLGIVFGSIFMLIGYTHYSI